MRNAASELFGNPESLHSRPNEFGEITRILISPSRDVEEAVNWVIGGGRNPDITLHMRMLMNRSVRAAQAALNCLKRETRNLRQGSRPRVVVISDTPSFVRGIAPNISEVAEIGDRHLGENSTTSRFSFLSSFQGNLLAEGLKLQVGWGHVWNRFAGPLSCRGQRNQCAFTTLLPPAWWEGQWQSPIPRDIHRLEQYGIQLSGLGTTDENQIRAFCSSRKNIVKTVSFI
ncbi:hypothetical protein F3Y22_tig00111467pilonHSYRG00039 [Hibiscus syriacus]|uniref:Uncharacterized protein n=1 Tax=Hibiscus syriacus TaxID=106335 RepID=A0A6A2YJV7_HIBSY|nr:hypothetical protein F3Y22_tig00111467pilonHSYRG00039 [Hibiscus syriacus]